MCTGAKGKEDIRESMTADVSVGGGTALSAAVSVGECLGMRDGFSVDVQIGVCMSFSVSGNMSSRMRTEVCNGMSVAASAGVVLCKCRSDGACMCEYEYLCAWCGDC